MPSALDDSSRPACWLAWSPRERARAGPGLDAAESGRQDHPDVKKFGKETDFKCVVQPKELSPACAGYTIGIVLPVTGSVAAI